MQSKPNVILVLCDDLGYGDLGCYGSRVNLTPTLDRMAQEGVTLTDYYAAPLCSPSRAAMMTGCYPQRVGLGRGENFFVLMPGDAIGLDPSEYTLPRMFKNEGYRTHMVGKWHLGDQPEFLPQQHGFDHYFGLPYSNDMLPAHPKSPITRFPPLPVLRDQQVIEVEPVQQGLTDRYLYDALSFIRAEDERPFFLYFAHMYVHRPIFPAERFYRRGGNGTYGAAVAHIDWCMARMLEALEERGIAEDTLVIFTSDNGSEGTLGGSNAPLRGYKAQALEGGSRVPCIFWWKGKLHTGTSDEITCCMDLLPTLANLIGTTLPEDAAADGADLSELLLHGNGDCARDSYFYYLDDHLHAVRHGPLKYFADTGALFNLAEDIHEAHDIAADYPEIVDEMRAMIDACRTELGDRTLGIAGNACRAPGRVSNPRTLTTHERDGIFIRMEYD